MTRRDLRPMAAVALSRWLVTTGPANHVLKSFRGVSFSRTLNLDLGAIEGGERLSAPLMPPVPRPPRRRPCAEARRPHRFRRGVTTRA